jgi:HEAT repeat protein
VEPLIAALNDQDSVVRRAASAILGRIGGAQAVEPLRLALGDQQEDVRKAAAEALDRIGPQPK